MNTIDVGEPTSQADPAQADAGWTDAFLWLAGDDSAGKNGEHIRTVDFV